MQLAQATASPLIVTADDRLLAELMRLCAAADVTPQVVRDPEQARATWWQASCVLVGLDQAEQAARSGHSRRGDVWLVSAEPESARLWRLGVAVRADEVVVLPAAEGWLVERLSDSVDSPTERGRGVAVIGACGGAGASTLAAGLGLRAAGAGYKVLLVDADPLGGGLELLLGCEAAPGLRWPEVAATQGRVTATALREALPSADGVALLSWDRGGTTDVEPAAMRAMVDAGRRGADLVLVDLPRRLGAASAEAAALVDITLLVCLGDVRAVASAQRLLAVLRPLCADLRLVVRRTPGADLAADALASTLQLPLAGELGTQRRLPRAVNDGLGPGARGRFGHQCGRILDELRLPRARAGR